MSATRNNKKILLLVLLVFILSVFSWQKKQTEQRRSVARLNGQKVTLVGRVMSEMDSRLKNVRFDFAVDGVKGANKMETEGKILVTTEKYSVFRYGERLALVCDLKAPKPFNDFAYDRYLARFGIYSLCAYPEIKSLGMSDELWSTRIFLKIFSFKDELRHIINRGLVEPEAGLLRAILFGDRNALDDDLKNAFSVTGLSHLTAISGLNITILVFFLEWLLIVIGFWRRQAFYLVTIFLVLYVLGVGAPASAVRAGVMGFLALLAKQTGRLNSLGRAAWLAAMFMAAYNPLIVRDDIGFQLSFLAILSIAYLYPILKIYTDRYLAWFSAAIFKSGIFRGGVDALLITLAAQIFTWPIIAYNFGQVSLIAPVTNLLVVWTSPLVMVGGLGAIFFAYFLPGLSVLIFLPLKIILHFTILVAQIFVRVPHAAIMTSELSFLFIIFYFGLLSGFIYRMRMACV